MNHVSRKEKLNIKIHLDNAMKTREVKNIIKTSYQRVSRIRVNYYHPFIPKFFYGLYIKVNIYPFE